MMRTRRRIIVDENEFYENLKEEIQENVRIAVSELLVELKPLLMGKSIAKEQVESIGRKQLGNIPTQHQIEQVSTAEVRRRWGKSRTTIRKCCKEYAIQPSGKYGRQHLYSFDDMVRIFGYPVI
jgi:hypothetical protein